MRRQAPWFEDDRFWSVFRKALFPPQRVAATQEQAGQIATLLGLKPGQAILDLCCGPGRFSLEFARRGFKVTGVDRTKYLLDKARTRARSARVKVEFVHKDMRDFVRPDSFDLVLSMYT